MLRCTLALLTLTSMVACANGSDGDDAGTNDTVDNVYGGLDKNLDGNLDEDDADDGALAIAYVRVKADGTEDDTTEEAASTLTATLRPGGSGGWYVEATLPDDSTLSIRFVNEEALTVMEGAITNASLNPPTGGDWFAYESELAQKVAVASISSDGTTASGALTDAIEIGVYGMNEAPTGETIQIKGFGFKDIPVSAPQ